MQTQANNRYFTPPTYAKRLGVKPQKILGFIADGSLAAIDISIHPGEGNPRWRITPEAAAEFERSRTSRKPITNPTPPRHKARAGRTYHTLKKPRISAGTVRSITRT